jgi:hypothetical protein
MKKVWGNRLTSIFPRQGHYALDPNNIANYPAAGLTVERVGDLVDCGLSTLPGKAGSKSSEESA